MMQAPVTATARGASPKVRYEPSNDFHLALKARVERYFRMTGRSPRDCSGMYLKTGIVIGAFVSLYLLLVFAAAAWWQAVPLAVGLGLAAAAIGFNVQHDGGHRAYSRYGWVNRIMAAWMDVLGASSLFWARKHNTLHHTYTNLDGHDDDLDVGPWARMSPHQKRHAFHRLQHLYVWALYAVLVAKWQFYDDFRDLALGRIGSHRIRRPRGWELAQFIGGKAVFLLIAFVLPSLFHPVGVVLLFYAVSAATAGVVLSVVFQLAHVVEEAGFPDPDPATGRVPTPWAIHQLRTTVDFARGNRALSWFVGGLNFQVEHHLFPGICHLHYPRIARIVENACRRAGVRYHALPSLPAAIRSHYRWLKRMGSGAESAAATA